MVQVSEFEKKYFIVSLLCRNGQYDRFMSSGVRTNSSGRMSFMDSTSRDKAQQFSKFAAEELVVKLKEGWRLTAKVEPAPVSLAPYARV